MERVDGSVQLGDHAQPLAGDPRGHEAAVGGVALAADQAGGLHAVQQPAGVGHLRHQPLAHLVAAQPALARAAQDAQRVVLRAGDAVRLEHLGHRVAQDGGRALDAEVRLLLQARERPRLPDLVTECRCHGEEDRCS